MQIQPYQFIKYNRHTENDHIKKVHNSGAVVCFDFEDGILNPLEMDRSASLKKEAREHFKNLYSLICKFNTDIKVGVRLNTINSSDFEKDLIAIYGISVFTSCH